MPLSRDELPQDDFELPKPKVRYQFLPVIALGVIALKIGLDVAWWAAILVGSPWVFLVFLHPHIKRKVLEKPKF